jgi:hypothetical protein
VTLPSSQAIQPRFRTIDGLSIRYAESEDRADHALLLGPWPESLYCYAQTWPRLAARARLVAIDLPGFGHSERRDGLMSPSAMGGFILRAADEFGLEHPHVVGPDVGTNAALFAATGTPTRARSSPPRWRPSSATGSRPTSRRTTSRPTGATGSSSRCGTSAPTRSSFRSCAICCPASRPRCSTSPAVEHSLSRYFGLLR